MTGRASPRTGSTNARFVAGLDHLRAVAAMLVVFHHGFWQATAFHHPSLVDAWPRVDSVLFAPLLETHFAMAVFFVLSGFVLTLTTYRRRVSYVGYLRNRGLRVLPVFLLVLLAGVAIFPERFSLEGFVASATLFGNVRQASLQLDPVTTALWTVAVEFQFYLVLPMLSVMLDRQGARPLLFMIGLMLALRFLGFFFLFDPTEHGIFAMNYWFFVPGRLDQFLIGMLGARFYLRWARDPRAPEPAAPWATRLLDRHALPAFVLLVAGLFGWTYALNQLGGAPRHALWKFAWPTGEALLCAGLLLTYTAVVHRVPRPLTRALTVVGNMSFSIYVVHFMFVSVVIGDLAVPEALPGYMVDFMGRWGVSLYQNAALNTLLLLFPAVLGGAYLLHRAVEVPFMGLRGRYVTPMKYEEGRG